MKKFQKFFNFTLILTTVLWGASSVLLNPLPAKALTAGDLIKAPNSTAVYYITQNSQKYVFPSGEVFLSWYPDFSLVNTVSQETLQNYQTVGNVVVRAGTKLIQFVAINGDGSFNIDDPKVYALEPNGTRRWITSAEIAQQLYGTNWETKIYPVPNFLISNYPLGTDLTSASYPVGSVVKNNGGTDVYYINISYGKQHLTGLGFSANLLQDNFIYNTSLDLTGYPTGAEINALDPEISSIVPGTVITTPEHTYYVAMNGNDNNSGTVYLPFGTIAKAAQTATAGDIIYIRGGTYNETVTPPNSGTENNYITFNNYPGETVYVKGVGNYVFYLDNVDYIKINGLKISRGLGSGQAVIPAYKPYRGTVAHGAGIKIFWADHNIITNNDIYDNDIGIFVSEGGLDMENTFPSTYNQIINNTIHHSGEAGIRIKRSDYTTVDSNTVYNNGLQGNNVYAEPAAGITYYCSIGVTITNNTVYGDSSSAIDNYAGTNQDTCDASSILIANNILSQTLSRETTNYLYANKKIVLIINEKEAVDASHVYKNNIFYNGTLGNDIVTWGVNNTNTVGEAMTLAEFNAAANALNSESGISNIEVSTNPVQ